MTLSFVSAMPIGLAPLCDEFFDEMTSDAIESAFRVPATLRSLTFVRCALALVLDREPWSPEDSGRLLLAASEAVSNAIEHGSPVDGGQIEVQVIVQRDGATLIVTDEGSGADPPAIDPLSEPPSDSSPRGRGFPIMQSLADDVHVSHVGAGTRIAMRFAVQPDGAPGAADTAAGPSAPAGAAGDLIRLNRVQDV
jgi:anti-sigma regulatory factor (Ser/Thr protein kinase)